ncbi:helix-turn-helix transcriptional regulator [Chromobacterium alticapitis]|uniref:Transcriptional regulator n=1 Tax=Chromobacterium alticapitis TaxID=2073169 RepID=A0A2S5DIJ3_9NEIS|nr:helix-turn-helix transcriptional regulator [Chromobacterium alticapitis]POZ62906.1 transcriptional regulator [Chromobacterium alticapitis]
MNRTDHSETIRLAELGAFLRSRRESLNPSMVGLPSGMRRRTPGLRREEVAMLADIGTAWYTWLEQGRDVQASPGVLASLAGALRLSEAERRHLFALAGRPAPDAAAPGNHIEPSLLRMLDNLRDQPAYITGLRWDILAWNRAAAALFGDYRRLPPEERNLLRMVFANPAHRALLAEWDSLARAALAMFRADYGRHAGDPAFERLVDALNRDSGEFRAWWPRREVQEPLSGIKLLNHPQQGRMSFEYSSFALQDGSERRLTLFTPLPDDDSAAKLAALLAD